MTDLPDGNAGVLVENPRSFPASVYQLCIWLANPSLPPRRGRFRQPGATPLDDPTRLGPPPHPPRPDARRPSGRGGASGPGRVGGVGPGALPLAVEACPFGAVRKGKAQPTAKPLPPSALSYWPDMVEVTGQTLTNTTGGQPCLS